MASTYVPIQTYTLGSAQSSVTFSVIPSTYTDLIIWTNAGNSAAADHAILVQMGNGSVDTGSNYSCTFLYGNGSAGVSGRNSNQTSIIASRTAGTITSNGSIMLQNYSNTTTYKTLLSRGNNPAGLVVAYAGLWRSTSAVDIIKLTDESGANFITGSTFTLYGIKAA